MSFDLHTVDVVAGTPAKLDRLTVGLLPAQAFGVGASAGASVAVNVTGLRLPATYMVFAAVNEDATVQITSKTSTGFTFTVAPRLAANTLAAGAIDLMIVA